MVAWPVVLLVLTIDNYISNNLVGYICNIFNQVAAIWPDLLPAVRMDMFVVMWPDSMAVVRSEMFAAIWPVLLTLIRSGMFASICRICRL